MHHCGGSPGASLSIDGTAVPHLPTNGWPAALAASTDHRMIDQCMGVTQLPHRIAAGGRKDGCDTSCLRLRQLPHTCVAGGAGFDDCSAHTVFATRPARAGLTCSGCQVSERRSIKQNNEGGPHKEQQPAARDQTATFHGNGRSADLVMIARSGS